MNTSINKTMIGLTLLAVTFGTAWTVGKGARTKTPRVVKNLAKTGDIDGTVEVGRRLLADLQAHNYNWNQVDQSLLSVPDQYNYQFAPQAEGTWTWSRCPQSEYDDDVAFYSHLYTWNDMTVVPGIEGRLTVTGSYIVGWKNGTVEKVPVQDIRLYPSGSKRYVMVFPGMDEYDSSLPTIGDSDFSAKLAKYKAATKKTK